MDFYNKNNALGLAQNIDISLNDSFNTNIFSISDDLQNMFDCFLLPNIKRNLGSFIFFDKNNALYDLYGSLLTEKQREYFEDYYFHNLSYAEMADNYDVSRNAMFKQVHIVVEKLKEYEEALQLFKKKMILLELAEKVSDKKVKETLENIF